MSRASRSWYYAEGAYRNRHQYEDRVLTTDSFQWQSQNLTTQASVHGQNIRQHVDRGIAVHLFVRADSKTARGRAAPFVYCGDVDFVSWQGDQPITVTWQLRESMPARVWNTLGGRGGTGAVARITLAVVALRGLERPQVCQQARQSW